MLCLRFVALFAMESIFDFAAYSKHLRLHEARRKTETVSKREQERQVALRYLAIMQSPDPTRF
jgi:hypothetical protein